MPTSRAGTSSRPDGFTLVELAVAVFLIVLFSALALPLLGSVGRDPLSAAARRLTGNVKYLYDEAALTGMEHLLAFRLDRGTYRAFRLEPREGVVEKVAAGREQQLPEEVRILEVAVSGRGSYTAGEVEIRIFPVGWVEETQIRLADRRGAQTTLRITPLTGTVEVLEGEGER